MAVTTPGLNIDELLTDNTQLIGGEWVPGANGQTIDVINPATTEVLLRVPRGDAQDIDAATRAAQAAFPAWRDLNPSRRGEILYRWGELCREHAAQISTLESMEVGHPYWGPSPVGDFLIYTAGMADKVRGETLPTKWPSLHAMTWRQPYGVVGIIIPWNGPAPVMTFDVAPALAAGNAVVVKPAEDAPLACLYVAKLGIQAGLPPGVLNLVTGYGPEAGAPLAGHPLVRRMSFTGSPETGAKIMEQCAKHLIPLHIESGGKSPQIVFRDADLEKAIPGIVRMITLNTGQVCAAGSRLLVDPAMRTDVVSAIKDAFGKVRVGPWHAEVDMGPLINAKQEKRVLGYMDIGREEGAEVVTGGAKLTGEPYDHGFFVPPTIFDNVRPEMRIAQEEIFGPVLSVLTFEDEQQALEIANGTRYGLTATVWTKDVSRALRLARAVDVGHVYINTTGSFGVHGAPWGGYKMSGFGRTMAADTILDYTQVKTVVIETGA